MYNHDKIDTEKSMTLPIMYVFWEEKTLFQLDPVFFSLFICLTL